MNTQQFLNLKQSLKPGQSLVLDFDGKVRIMGPRKKDVQIVGYLESFDEAIVPLREKPWANISTPGIKSFTKFGTPPPKYDRVNDENRKIKIETALGIFEALKAMEMTPKKSIWVDTYFKFSYDVEELGGVKIYKYNNVIRYVEFEGEKYDVPQLKPELKTQIFKKE